MRSALVIVPTYNENDNVAALTAAVLAACPDVHLLFVDDNSPDGTGQTLDAIAAGHGHVQVLQFIVNRQDEMRCERGITLDVNNAVH